MDWPPTRHEPPLNAMSNPALSDRGRAGTARSALRVGALVLAVLTLLVAWIMLAARTRVTVIVQAPVGTAFSVNGDIARPRLRPGARSPGAAELHYLRLTPGAHEITVTDPSGVQHAHMLQIAKRDRPLQLRVRNHQLEASGATNP
jgi:hypothetical protein